MAYRKITFPCGLSYEVKGWNFASTTECFEASSVKEALSKCPLHGKKCKRTTNK